MIGRSSDYTPLHDDPGTDGGEVFILPTSFAQERIWFLDQLEPGQPAYNVPINFHLAGALDIEALRGALSLLVQRHETLRTVFELHDGVPQQVILPAAPFPLAIEDLSGLDEATRVSALARRVETEGAASFDLANGPVIRARLLRLADDEHALLLTIHHIAVDGWSLGILQRELGALYGALVRRELPALPELPIQYSDFAAWQRERLEGGELESQLAYWRERLAGSLPPFDFPTDRPRVAGRERPADSVAVEISRATTDGLLALAREAGVTPFIALLAAFQVLLHRYTGEEDVIVGSPVAGRTQRETEGLIGWFVNTLAMRLDLSGAPHYREVLRRAREMALGALAQQDVPFERVVNAVHPDRDASRTPIFQTLFSFQDFGAAQPLALPGLQLSRLAGVRGSAKFELQLIMNQRPSGFRGSLEFDASLLDAESAQRLMRHFVVLLDGIVAAPDRPVSRISLLDEAEETLVVRTFNRTTTDYPRDAFVHDLFAAEAVRRPDAVAVRAGELAMTYAELDASAGVVAARLRQLGVSDGGRVAVCADRSLASIVTTLGILKADAAYVPLDTSYPADRLGFMLADAVASVVIVQRSQQATLDRVLAATAWRGPIVYVDDEGRLETVRVSEDVPHASAPARRDSTDSGSRAAYVMYTSGSTGRPKGVLVPHRAIVRLVRDTSYLTLTERDVVLGFAPAAFDASTLELWGPLLNGGQLVLAPPGLPGLDILGELVERAGVTVMWLTAALFHQVVEGGLARYRGVRAILAGGDVLAPADVVRVLAELPHCTLINGYGPTENTTFTCCYAVPRNWRGPGSVPLGRPIANTRVYVLDAAGAPVPVGVPGELYAGGDGVALGYLGRPELTAERFVPDTFATGPAPGARLYRTGDRVRWRPDGTVEFLGRMDQQVKIRGFRVEPGEVEAVLAGHPAVRDAAVIAVNHGSGPRLVGYYVPRETADFSGAPSGSALTRALRGYLRERLPEYLVPSLLVPLAELPVGPTGKLDRRALPAPQVASDPSGNYVAPRTTIEHQFTQIWESLLDVHPVGIHDDFFELGGHSLLAVRMLAEMERLTGRRVPLATLFHGATIERLATHVESSLHAQAEPPFVVLKPEGRHPPIVFLHGDVTGGGWYCRRLAPLLDFDAPMIVLPTLREEAPDSPATIKEMALHHLAEVQRLQPRGPYRLVGYCAGGAIAYEMARQLEKRGHEVERLVLIDSVAANARFRWIAWLVALVSWDRSRSKQLTERARLFKKLGYYAGRLRAVRRLSHEERWRWFRKQVKGRLPGVDDPVDRVLDQQSEDLLRAADLDARPGQDVLRFQSRAARAYVPGRYRGSVDLVVAANGPVDDSRLARIRASGRGWDRVAAEVRVHVFPSSHVGLITDQIPMLADALSKCFSLSKDR